MTTHRARRRRRRLEAGLVTEILTWTLIFGTVVGFYWFRP
jgi:hypothetical protein